MGEILKLGGVWGIALALCGCASLTPQKRHQYVYIQSNPSNAVIFDNGRKIGSTPALVSLPRNKTYELELQRGAEKKTLFLETKYAWNESFLGNLILFGLAPFGWLTDLATGSAWDYQDPELVQFSKSAQVETKPPRIALAPPIASTFRVSDEAAQYWEKQFPKMYPHARFIPYKESLPIFQDNGYEFDGRPTENQSYRQVLYNLDADQIFLSEVHETSNKAEMRAHLQGLSGEVLEEKSEEVSLEKSLGWNGTSLEILPSWFQFIPNTLAMEFANTHVQLSDVTTSYVGVETDGRFSFGESLRYLQALTLNRLQISRQSGASRWKFQFTPSARFSYKTIFFPYFDKLADVNFDYLQVGAGIGPEVGYQSGRHYTYMKMIPLLTYNQVDWNQPGGQAEKMAIGALDIQSEFGYLYFFTEHLSLRLFTKATSSSINLWNSIAHKVNPTTPQLSTASDAYSGIAFGYTFDFREHLISR
ncbi:MAG: PEGA domain-containing protein [Pseudobdellovibrionaceae bacterium]